MHLDFRQLSPYKRPTVTANCRHKFPRLFLSCNHVFGNYPIPCLLFIVFSNMVRVQKWNRCCFRCSALKSVCDAYRSKHVRWFLYSEGHRCIIKSMLFSGLYESIIGYYSIIIEIIKFICKLYSSTSIFEVVLIFSLLLFFYFFIRKNNKFQ